MENDQRNTANYTLDEKSLSNNVLGSKERKCTLTPKYFTKVFSLGVKSLELDK
jgi:hypothetical protein